MSQYTDTELLSFPKLHLTWEKLTFAEESGSRETDGHHGEGQDP